MLETLENLTSDRTLTPASDPRESAEVQVHTDSGDFRDEKEPTLQDQPNTTPERHDSDKGESAPSASDRKRDSAKENFIELGSILHALKTTVDYPDDLAKHNKVRTTIKKSNLSKFFTKSSTTGPLFAFAERYYNEWDLNSHPVNRSVDFRRFCEIALKGLKTHYLGVVATALPQWCTSWSPKLMPPVQAPGV